MLIQESRVNRLESIIDPENIHLSVKIINDELMFDSFTNINFYLIYAC